MAIILWYTTKLSSLQNTNYSTVSLVPPISTMDVYRYMTYSINLMGPLKREIQSTVTAADSCDGGISV